MVKTLEFNPCFHVESSRLWGAGNGPINPKGTFKRPLRERGFPKIGDPIKVP